LSAEGGKRGGTSDSTFDELLPEGEENQKKGKERFTIAPSGLSVSFEKRESKKKKKQDARFKSTNITAARRRKKRKEAF